MLMNRRDFLVKGGVVVGTSLIPNTALAVFGSSVRGTMGAAGAGVSGTSYSFDGNGDYLSMTDHADWDISASDFTLEFFIRVADATPSSDYAIWSQRVNNDDQNDFRLRSSGAFSYLAKRATVELVEIVSTAEVLTANTWHHVAYERVNDNYFIWVDGVDTLTSGSPDSDNPGTLSPAISIGRRGGGGSDFRGNLDEFRVSNISRYGSDFSGSVPSVEFTSDANTVFLMHCNEAIVSGTTGSGATFADSGNTGHTVTENGDAIRDTSIYKF
jgi:hypothetical protein